MTVTEVKQSLGSWEVRLSENTPRHILNALTYFGHVAIIPSEVDPAQYGDNMLTKARYVGVLRERDKRNELIIRGSGLAFWLGDEDDKGDVFENPVDLVSATFADSVNALLPLGGSIVAGTIYSVPGTYTGKHVWQTPRKALTYVTDTFGAEFRIRGDGTLDAGLVSDLYVTEPRALLLSKDYGTDLFQKALPGQMQLVSHQSDLTTRVVLLAEGEGDSISTGDADAPATIYKDLRGNPLKATRMISESETSAGNADVRAQLQLNRFVGVARSVNLSTRSLEVFGEFVVGDYINIYDPANGFYDEERELYWKGQPINPLALRCVEMTWPIQPGWTVAFRDINGNWIDLSPYYAGETGETQIIVGTLSRSLGSLGSEPPGIRPNLPNPGGADSTVPRPPVFTGFSVGSYQGTDPTDVKAAIRAQWSTPLNTDGSTVVDGDHYELRYRVNATIGYEVTWDTLMGYGLTLADTFGDRAGITNGWDDPEFGGAWVVQEGSTSHYSVDDGEGFIELTDDNQPHVIAAPVRADSNGRFKFTVDFMPTGAQFTMGAAIRYTDANNRILACVQFATDGAVTTRIFENQGGVFDEIGVNLVIDDLEHVAGTAYWLAYNCYDNQVMVKGWRDGDDEPDWHQTATTTVPATDELGGVYAMFQTGNTNAYPQTIPVDYLSFNDRNPANAYSWDDLGSWDALLSEPVEADPRWYSVVAGWDDNAFTLQELTPGVQYEIQIRAVDAASPPNRSAWSPSTMVTTTGDLFAPSTPAAPLVAASRIAIQVVHTLGRSSGGEFNLEPDLAHLEVHVGGSDSFLPESSTKVGELIANGGMVLSEIAAVGTFQIEQIDEVYVKVVAVDRSGNKSGASEASTATAELIDNAHISDLSVSKLTAGTISTQILLAGSIEVGDGGNVDVTDGAFRVFEGTTGQIKVKAGYDADTDSYDMFAVNPLNNQLVSLSTMAFGLAWDGEGGTVYTDDDFWDSNGGPNIFDVRIGNSRRCLVFLQSEISWDPFGSVGVLDTRTGFMGFRVVDQADTSIVFDGADNYAIFATVDDPNTGTGVTSLFNEFGVFYLGPDLIPAAGTYQFEALYKSQTEGSVGFQGRAMIVLPY